MGGNRVRFLTTLAKRSVADFFADRCPQFAAAVAYHVLFSIFPLAIVLAGIFGIVLGATELRADIVDAIVRNVPLSEEGDERLRDLLDQTAGGLSALGLFGIVGLIWAASGMMAAIRAALNAAWDTEDPRPVLRGKLVDVGLVLGAAVLATVSLGLTILVRTLGGPVGARAGIDPSAGWVAWILAVAIPLVLAFGVVSFLYRFVPPAEVRFRDIWPGALLAASVFVLAQNLFAVYVENFADYNAVYGSLGAVIAFMFFVYLSSLIFLFGAEVASEWPRVRRALEEGPEDPEDGPPLSVQARQALKGLWVRERRREAEDAEKRGSEARRG